jgi:hypothetical protein
MVVASMMNESAMMKVETDQNPSTIMILNPARQQNTYRKRIHFGGLLVKDPVSVFIELLQHSRGQTFSLGNPVAFYERRNSG